MSRQIVHIAFQQDELDKIDEVAAALQQQFPGSARYNRPRFIRDCVFAALGISENKEAFEKAIQEAMQQEAA